MVWLFKRKEINFWWISVSMTCVSLSEYHTLKADLLEASCALLSQGFSILFWRNEKIPESLFPQTLREMNRERRRQLTEVEGQVVVLLWDRLFLKKGWFISFRDIMLICLVFLFFFYYLNIIAQNVPFSNVHFLKKSGDNLGTKLKSFRSDLRAHCFES